jgi:hypothetical protein
MVLVVWHGNSSTGGPLIVDNLPTEAVCKQRMAQIEAATPRALDGYIIDMRPKFVVKACIQK